jgi:hypothetical protein
MHVRKMSEGGTQPPVHQKKMKSKKKKKRWKPIVTSMRALAFRMYDFTELLRRLFSFSASFKAS